MNNKRVMLTIYAVILIAIILGFLFIINTINKNAVEEYKQEERLDLKGTIMGIYNNQILVEDLNKEFDTIYLSGYLTITENTKIKTYKEEELELNELKE